MTPDRPAGTSNVLDRRTIVLVRIAAVVALGGPPAELSAAVDEARAAGVRPAELVEVLRAVAPAIGLAGTVGVAPALAAAMGIDLDGPLEELDTGRDRVHRSE